MQTQNSGGYRLFFNILERLVPVPLGDQSLAGHYWLMCLRDGTREVPHVNMLVMTKWSCLCDGTHRGHETALHKSYSDSPEGED